MYDSEQFYPTPDNVIETMKSHIKVRLDHHSRILDPSAGTGSILDSFVPQRKNYDSDWDFEKANRNHYGVRHHNLYAIEIEYDKRFIIQSKNYRVIGTDFLDFWEPQEFDLIIMNPPFNKGVDHILKAWEFVKDGGQLIGIINSGTVENQYSQSRKLLYQMISDFGYTDNLGQCFHKADRTTDVDVTLIVMNKPKRTHDDKFKGFDGVSGCFKIDDKVDIDFQANPITSTNVIDSLVAQYKAAENALIGKLRLNEELKFYLSGIDGDNQEVTSRDASESLVEKVNLEDQLQVLKSRFWNTVFSRSQMSSRMTTKFRDKFREFSKSQSRMAFSKDNILEVFMLFFSTQEETMADAITEVFDIACRFDEKNKVHTEGWKTNDSWKVNSKVILPYGVEISKFGGDVSFSRWGRAFEFLKDLDKVLCYIIGKDPNELEMSAVNCLSLHIRVYNDPKTPHPYNLSQEIDSTFLKIKIYKKGTIHLKFKDLDLLDEFNYRAGLGKLWIPDESSNARSSRKKNVKMTIVK